MRKSRVEKKANGVLYTTDYGKAVVARSEDFLPSLPDSSVDLVITSPPFALLRQKSYGI